MFRRKALFCGVAMFAAGIFFGAWLVTHEHRVSSATSGIRGTFGVPAAHAQGSRPPMLSPVKARPRDAYFPNSEDLGPNEMRVIACGTGMPTARPSQAAACVLVELGNGDKFIFDVGTGSAERIAALQIPYNYLAQRATKVNLAPVERIHPVSQQLPSLGSFGNRPVNVT